MFLFFLLLFLPILPFIGGSIWDREPKCGVLVWTFNLLTYGEGFSKRKKLMYLKSDITTCLHIGTKSSGLHHSYLSFYFLWLDHLELCGLMLTWIFVRKAPHRNSWPIHLWDNYIPTIMDLIQLISSEIQIQVMSSK